MNKLFLRLWALAILITFAGPLFPQSDTGPWSPVPEPYHKGEIPSWARDLRRSSIITLGSVPFTVMGVSLGYSIYQYINSGFDPLYTPNPFSKNPQTALSAQEQYGVILGALGISLLIGTTDLIISAVKRKNLEKKQRQAAQDGSLIIVEPYKTPEEDPPTNGETPVQN